MHQPRKRPPKGTRKYIRRLKAEYDRTDNPEIVNRILDAYARYEQTDTSEKEENGRQGNED